MKKILNEQGQTLIEALVALAIAVTIVGAITVAVVTALSNVQYSKNQSLAAQYAAEGMEKIRNLRDSDWGTFKSQLTTNYCFDSSFQKTIDNIIPCNQNQQHQCNSDNQCTSPNVGGIFSRGIVVNPNSAECSPSIAPPPASPIINQSSETKVTITVKWTDGKCSGGTYCHSSSLVSCFSDYKVISEPGSTPTATPTP